MKSTLLTNTKTMEKEEIVGIWRGEVITENTPKEKLIEIIKFMAKEINDTHELRERGHALEISQWKYGRHQP